MGIKGCAAGTTAGTAAGRPGATGGKSKRGNCGAGLPKG